MGCEGDYNIPSIPNFVSYSNFPLNLFLNFLDIFLDIILYEFFKVYIILLNNIQK